MPEIQIAQGTLSASGDTTVIAAQTGRKLKITGLQLQNASGVKTTVVLKFGSTVVLSSVFVAEGDGVVRDFGILPVPYETAVVVNLSVSQATHYQFLYEVV